MYLFRALSSRTVRSSVAPTTFGPLAMRAEGEGFEVGRMSFCCLGDLFFKFDALDGFVCLAF